MGRLLLFSVCATVLLCGCTYQPPVAASYNGNSIVGTEKRPEFIISVFDIEKKKPEAIALIDETVKYAKNSNASAYIIVGPENLIDLVIRPRLKSLKPSIIDIQKVYGAKYISIIVEKSKT